MDREKDIPYTEKQQHAESHDLGLIGYVTQISGKESNNVNA